MLVIRLARIGKKHQPAYRIIISEKHKDTYGDYLEKLGFYNPGVKPRTIELNEERIKYWLSQGAQASPTIHNLLVDAKIVSGPKKKATTVKKKKIEEKPEEKTEASEGKPAEKLNEKLEQKVETDKAEEVEKPKETSKGEPELKTEESKQEVVKTEEPRVEGDKPKEE